MRPVNGITVSSATSSPVIQVDYSQNNFNVSFGCVVAGGSTLTYKVQYTYDDPSTKTDSIGSNLNWFDHATVTGKTANADGNITFPVRAIRLTVTAWTVGSVTITVLQGRK